MQLTLDERVEMLEMRREYDGGRGSNICALARHYASSRSRVHYWIRRQGWRADTPESLARLRVDTVVNVMSGDRAAYRTPVREPSSVIDGLRRRCPDCYGITFSDPCHLCGGVGAMAR